MMEEIGFEGGKPCMIRRIPNGSRARGMNARHSNVSKCMETGQSEGNSVEKHFTVVIHRRCDTGKSGGRNEIGWGLNGSLKICIYFGSNQKTLTSFKQ